MKKFVLGVITAFAGLYLVGDAYNRGRDAGIKDCMETLDLLNTLKNTDEEEEKS